MKEVEYRTECATCGRVINREFVERPDYYKKIIVTHGICRLGRNRQYYKPDYDREAAALNDEDIRRMNNLISRRERIR